MNKTYFCDTSCEEKPRADNAWTMSNVCRATGTRDTSLRTIGDGILLGMYSGLFMAITNNGLVGRARQETVIALAHNPVLFDEDAADF